MNTPSRMSRMPRRFISVMQRGERGVTAQRRIDVQIVVRVVAVIGAAPERSASDRRCRMPSAWM